MVKKLSSIFLLLLPLLILSCDSKSPVVSVKEAVDRPSFQREYVGSITPDPAGVVVFVSDDSWDDLGPRVFMVNSDGSNLTELSSVNSAQFSCISEIALSPDLGTLALIATRGGAENLFLLDIQSGECQRITNDGTTKNDLSWSPDGHYLVYNQIDSESLFSRLEYEIFIADVVSAESRQLTHTDGHASEPIWTGDSETVVFSNSAGYSRVYDIVSISGDAPSLTQSELRVIYLSSQGIYPDFDYESFGAYWDSQSEIQITTPSWQNRETYLTFPPLFHGPAVAAPDSENVILTASIGGAQYFAVVDVESFFCEILEPESSGYPYQSSTSDMHWVDDNSFVFFGHRGRFEGIGLLSYHSGQFDWLVNNENDAYDFGCWDYAERSSNDTRSLTIDEICLSGLVVPAYSSRDDLNALLGNCFTKSYPRESQFGEGSDSVIVSRYPGLEVKYIQTSYTSPPTEEVRWISITSEEYLNEYGLSIGDSPERVHSIYGGLNRGSQYYLGELFHLEYQKNNSESGQVTFAFLDDGLIEMQVAPYYPSCP